MRVVRRDDGVFKFGPEVGRVGELHLGVVVRLFAQLVGIGHLAEQRIGNSTA